MKTLEQDLETEKATTAHYRDKVIAFNAAAMAQVKALEDFGKVQEASGSYDREVKDVQAKHDLGALASKKPGLIEARVNAGSARVLRLLEQATEPPASASK
ncbi:i-spanin [Pseudomonas phage ZQG1]|nr:i-spanin [Pseudomonas phage ZQG1]